MCHKKKVETVLIQIDIQFLGLLILQVYFLLREKWNKPVKYIKEINKICVLKKMCHILRFFAGKPKGKYNKTIIFFSFSRENFASIIFYLHKYFFYNFEFPLLINFLKLSNNVCLNHVKLNSKVTFDVQKNSYLWLPAIQVNYLCKQICFCFFMQSCFSSSPFFISHRRSFFGLWQFCYCSSFTQRKPALIF